MTTDVATCSICGEPMPEHEQMFKFHGYSGPCPKPPLPRPPTEVEVLKAELSTTRAQVAGMRTLIEDFIAAEDAVNAEAASCEAQGRAWSSAPLVGRIFAVQALREALSPTPAEKATTPGRSAE